MMIELAREMSETAKRGGDLGLKSDERAFCDALSSHGFPATERRVMGVQQLVRHG